MLIFRVNASCLSFFGVFLCVVVYFSSCFMLLNRAKNQSTVM
jgi:hypothetical protein